MCVLYDNELKLMSSVFPGDRGTQGKSFLTQINTADFRTAADREVASSHFEIKEAKMKCQRTHASAQTTSCQREGELIAIRAGTKKKKMFYFTDDLLCSLITL